MDIHQTARDILTRRGIDPDALPPLEPPNVAETLVENATTALAMHLPALFLNASCDHEQVRAWVRRFLTDPTTAGTLLLLGPTGTGKTHQAAGALRACVLQSARRRRPMSWQFTDHPSLNAALRPAADDAHLVAYDRAEQVDLLVLDDLGAGKTSDWTADTLYRLINARWANQRPTIVTTNLMVDPPPLPGGRPAPSLRTTLGDPIVSRLLAGTVVGLIGADRRRAGVA